MSSVSYVASHADSRLLRIMWLYPHRAGRANREYKPSLQEKTMSSRQSRNAPGQIGSGASLRRVFLVSVHITPWVLLFFLGYMSSCVPNDLVHYVCHQTGLVPSVGVQPLWFGWVLLGVELLVFVLAWYLLVRVFRTHGWRNWRVAFFGGMATATSLGFPSMVVLFYWYFRGG